MSAPVMHDAMKMVLAPVRERAAAIESAFLAAGDKLGRGLSAFQALNGDVTTLAEEAGLGAGATAQASLARFSQTVVGLARRLPEDGRILAELVAENGGAAERFDLLNDHMRMMTSVARLARIEAAAFDREQLGLDSFTEAIAQQIGDAQRAIGGCAGEHAKLLALLREAARQQGAFSANYGSQLVAFAGDLDEVLAVLERQRGKGEILTAEVGARAARIAQATGLALVSLQSGDAVRQRLEHVTDGLLGPSIGDEATGADDATVRALCRFGEAQLRDTVACFAAETDDNLRTLGLLCEQARQIVALGTATYGYEGGGSLMGRFRSRFAAALGLVRDCEAARRNTAETTAQLTTMMDGLSGTVEALAVSSQDLVLVGMNVGLRANRLGAGGRSLMTAAAELKRLAVEIAAAAQDLLPLVERTRQLSAGLKGERVEGAEPEGDLDRDFIAVVADLEAGDGRVAQLLGSLGRAGQDFEAQIEEAAGSFGQLVENDGVLLEAADRLRALGSAGGEPDADTLSRAGELLIPIYTMAREREIHAAVLGQAPDPSPALDGFDDFDNFETWAA